VSTEAVSVPATQPSAGPSLLGDVIATRSVVAKGLCWPELWIPAAETVLKPRVSDDLRPCGESELQAPEHRAPVQNQSRPGPRSLLPFRTVTLPDHRAGISETVLKPSRASVYEEEARDVSATTEGALCGFS
jgi:hypothetical protein